MTFTNLYRIPVKQKWQLNAQRATSCFKTLLLHIKHLTAEAQKRESQSFRIYRCGMIPHENICVNNNFDTSRRKNNFHKQVESMTHGTKLRLVNARAHMLGEKRDCGEWIISPFTDSMYQEFSFCNLICQVSKMSQ